MFQVGLQINFLTEGGKSILWSSQNYLSGKHGILCIIYNMLSSTEVNEESLEKSSNGKILIGSFRRQNTQYLNDSGSWTSDIENIFPHLRH